MSRVSRVPYHQNAYDFLGVDPVESPTAAFEIVEHEARYGPLPGSVREWYLVRDGLISRASGPLAARLETTIRLGEFLGEHAGHWRALRVGRADRGQDSWWIRRGVTDDPPVWYEQQSETDRDSARESPYTSFILSLVTGTEMRDHVLALGIIIPEPLGSPAPEVRPPGVWLRSHHEPFQPPLIDFLIDQFGEPQLTPRPGDVTTYTFRPPGGIIRVTADAPALTGGLSAWWVHADTDERLAEFARLLLSWGTLRDTLRADTDSAREVLKALRGV
jgi:hypothetical protein